MAVVDGIILETAAWSLPTAVWSSRILTSLTRIVKKGEKQRKTACAWLKGDSHASWHCYSWWRGLVSLLLTVCHSFSAYRYSPSDNHSRISRDWKGSSDGKTWRSRLAVSAAVGVRVCVLASTLAYSPSPPTVSLGVAWVKQWTDWARAFSLSLHPLTGYREFTDFRPLSSECRCIYGALWNELLWREWHVLFESGFRSWRV